MENIKEGKESDIDGDKLISFFLNKFLSNLQRNYLQRCCIGFKASNKGYRTLVQITVDGYYHEALKGQSMEQA